MKLLVVHDYFSTYDKEQAQGPDHWLQKKLFQYAGITDYEETFLFPFFPEYGNLAGLGGPKELASRNFPKVDKTFIRNEFDKYVEDFTRLVERTKPNLILGFGPVLGALLIGDYRVSKIRGSTQHSKFGKCLITYSPSDMLKDYTLKPILMADLSKVVVECEFPEVRRMQRFIHIEPSFDDIVKFITQYLIPADAISIDVETIGTQITCLGLAPGPDRAMVIPFYDPTKPSNNYWPTLEEELSVWKLIKLLLAQPKATIGQNFLYDTKFFWSSYGIIPHGLSKGDDTMLMHHAMQPELQKGLAFLGSIYTSEASWKLERKTETLKKES